MAQQVVAPNDRRIPITAILNQTDFLFNFPAGAEAELTVTKKKLSDGVVSNPAFTAVFTATGGTVTIAAQLAGDIITIEGTRTQERSSNYLPGGEYRADDINADMNLLTKAIQEDRRDLARSAQFPPEVADAVDATLPEPVASSILGFDATALLWELTALTGLTNPDVISQAEAEAGTATIARLFTAERVKQAILALETGEVNPDLISQVEAEGGTDTNERVISGLRLKQGIFAQVIAALDVATIPTATVASGDKVLIQDTDDSDDIKSVTALSIAELLTDFVGNTLVSVRIDEAAGINKGQVVYMKGSIGQNLTVALADKSIFSTNDVIAIANESGADNATIECMLSGEMTGLDTSAFVEGNPVYLDTAGDITPTHPTLIDAYIQVGIAGKINPSTGTIFVQITNHTITDNFDGVVRFQAVNDNTGVNAVSTFTAVNDAGHRVSIGITSSGHPIPDGLGVYNEGFGPTVFVNAGNVAFKWQADVLDLHARVFIEGTAPDIMELTPDGKLTIGGKDPLFPVTADITLIVERDGFAGAIYLKDLEVTKTFGDNDKDGTLIESNNGILFIGGAARDGTKSTNNISLDQNTGILTVKALTVNGAIIVTGLVDGRDVAADGTKLDGIEALADVTDEVNVISSLDGATISAATVATLDKVLIQDVDDSDNLKTVTVQAISDLHGTLGVTAANPFNVDNRLIRSNGASRDLQASGITISDTDEVTFVGETDHNGAASGHTAQTATGDGTTTIDWGLGNIMLFQFGAFNETFTFTAPAKPGIYTILLTQDSVGSRTATWPASVKWPGGTAPTLTTTATTGVDQINFLFNGTNFYGTSAADFS